MQGDAVLHDCNQLRTVEQRSVIESVESIRQGCFHLAPRGLGGAGIDSDQVLDEGNASRCRLTLSANHEVEYKDVVPRAAVNLLSSTWETTCWRRGLPGRR